jgi:hypothetical protein
MFTELFTEGELTQDDFLVNTEKDFKKEFPNGFFHGIKQNDFGKDYITISLGLIGDKNDVANGIRNNDPMNTTIIIHCNDDCSNNEMKSLISGLYVKPEEGSFLAMKHIKTGLRKTKGDLNKLQKSLKNYYAKMKKTVKNNKENIINSDKYQKYLKGM